MAPSAMRAIIVQGGKGPADAMHIETNVPMPECKDGEALVKIKAFGINRMDLIQRSSDYPVPKGASPILGVEFSGIIDSVGPGDMDGFKVGDEVFGLAYGGAYAEYIATPAKMLIHKPSELSWEEAAGIPENWITAIQALWVNANLLDHHTLLLHAGLSGVSIAAMQLALHHVKNKGSRKVYITTSSQEKIDFAKSLGATDGFNYKTGDWTDELLKATDGRGVDVIVDYIGGPYFAQNIKAAAQDGQIVLLGLLGGPTADNVNMGALIYKRLKVQGSTLRSRSVEYQSNLRNKLVEESFPMIKDGTMKVQIDKVFKWSEVVEAHKYVEKNTNMGKVICVVE